jgi:hypothetical protein
MRIGRSPNPASSDISAFVHIVACIEDLMVNHYDQMFDAPWMSSSLRLRSRRHGRSRCATRRACRDGRENGRHDLLEIGACNFTRARGEERFPFIWLTDCRWLWMSRASMARVCLLLHGMKPSLRSDSRRCNNQPIVACSECFIWHGRWTILGFGSAVLLENSELEIGIFIATAAALHHFSWKIDCMNDWPCIVALIN